MKRNSELLGQVPFDDYSLLEGFIDNLRSRHRIHLNIHDVAGLSAISPAMERLLEPYLYHNNGFCNYVKKNRDNFGQCVKQKAALCSACLKTDKPFFQRCYMGVEEFVFPIKWENTLIAVVCVGQFLDDPASAAALIRRRAADYALNEEQCVERYLETAAPRPNVRELCCDVGILCRQLQHFYMASITHGRISAGGAGDLVSAVDDYKSTYIVAKTIRFIRENYRRDLSLPLLASNSFCNASYLSYLFKRKTGINVSRYINQVRVEAAKEILDTTGKTITEVSFLVGFNDSNYFTKVFKQFTSMTPQSYRNRKT